MLGIGTSKIYIPSHIKLLCTLLAHHITLKRKKCEISRLIAMRSLEWIEIPYGGGQNPPDISFIAEVGYLWIIDALGMIWNLEGKYINKLKFRDICEGELNKW